MTKGLGASWIGTVVLVACGGARAPEARELPRSEHPVPPEESAPAAPEVAPAAPEPVATPASPPVAVAERSHFPPADVAPPSARSASAGDGHYTPLGDALLGERTATDPPLVVETVIHPHPASRFVTVTVAALDLRRVALRLVAGTDDLTWAKLAPPPEAGLVPVADRDRLVVVMNGGFQPKHGRRGLVANRVVVSRPREDGCTVLLDDDGRVRIGPFASLGTGVDTAASLREPPPCLLSGGAVHPALLAGKDSPWAGHAADLKTRRRSAIGLDVSGDVLFYAVGEEAEPRYLAEALRVAGAAVAAELDINWFWTRFLVFGDADGPLRVTSTLIPKMEHGAREYLERPSIRDFFYVVRRTP